MAKIRIVGRRDDLVVDNAKARKVAEAKQNITDQDTPIEIEHSLGVYTGVLRDIRGVERDRAQKSTESPRERLQAEERENRRKWQALTPKGKANKTMSAFKLWWAMRFGERISQDPPKELQAKVIKYLTGYYTKNKKTSLMYSVPHSVNWLAMGLIEKEVPVNKEVIKKVAEAVAPEYPEVEPVKDVKL